MNSTPPRVSICQIHTADDLEPYITGLATLLEACVNPDPAMSSIGFRAPLSHAEARDFWLALSPHLSSPVHLFILLGSLGSESHQVVGTVQLLTIPKVTHAHRAEVVKLLVHPSGRQLGLGTYLMDHAEEYARNELGLEMLTLDTASETPARKFYETRGWKEWGLCPRYADFADGRRADCSFFVKFLKDVSS